MVARADLPDILMSTISITDSDDPCWLWNGRRNPKSDYGMIHVDGVKSYAHRLSYETFVGPIPTGKHICHTCDTPPCICPAHLFPGTRQDNMQDAIRKGRFVYVTPPCGEASNLATLTESAVLTLRAEWDAATTRRGLSVRLAARFGIHKKTVWEIGTRRTWKHLP